MKRVFSALLAIMFIIVLLPRIEVKAEILQKTNEVKVKEAEATEEVKATKDVNISDEAAKTTEDKALQTLSSSNVSLQSNLYVIGGSTLNYYDDEIYLRCSLTDVYGNKVNIKSDKTLNYYINGELVKSEPIYKYYNTSDFTIVVKPNIQYPKYTIKLVQTITEGGTTSIESEPCEITVNMENYKIFDVKTPNGDIVKSADIIIVIKEINGEANKYFNIVDGKVAIPKEYEEFTVSYYTGVTDKGNKIYLNNIYVNKTDTEIYDKELKLYDININKDSFGKELENSEFDISGNGMYSQLVDKTDDNASVWLSPNKFFATFKTTVISDGKKIHKVTAMPLNDNNKVEVKDECTTKVNINFNNVDKADLTFKCILKDYDINISANKGDEIYLKPSVYKLKYMDYGLNNGVKIFGKVNSVIGTETFNISASNKITGKTNMPKIIRDNLGFAKPSFYDIEGREIMVKYNRMDIVVKNANTSEVMTQIPNNLEPGIYDITQIIKDENGEELTRVETLGVTVLDSSNGVYVNLYDKPGNFKIFDGDKEVYSNRVNNQYSYYTTYNLKGICDKSNEYTISKMTETYEYISDSIGVLKNEGSLELAQYTQALTYNMNTIDVSNLISYTITNSRGVTVGSKDLTYEAKKLSLIDGEEYTISGIIEDTNGYYYVTKKVISKADMPTIKLEKSLGSRVDFENKASGMDMVTSVNIKNQRGIELNINSLTCNKPLYLPKDKYTIDYNIPIGILGFTTNTKVVDANLATNKIVVGENIKYTPSISIDADKNLYVNFKGITVDGVALSDVNNVKVSDTTVKKLMHGNKVLRTLDNASMQKLKGKCSISLEETYPGVGKVTIDKYILDVDNQSTALVQEDINLDGVIDIYDLVAVSTSLGTTPGKDMWDYRVNLNSKDEVIDIADLSLVATKYNN